MRIIGFKDIQCLHILPEECYVWARDVIRHKKQACLPPKTHMNMPDNVFCNVMPARIMVGDFCAEGVKVVTRYPKRIPALDSKILLLDAKTGDNLAMLDGTWITAMRTGAVAAHSVLTFAKTGWQTIGMIGLGNTARASLMMLAEKEQRDIYVKLFRYKNQAELFAKRFEKYNHIHFEIVDTVEECIRRSDVIISGATYFENDIAKDEWFDEGVLVVPIHTRGFTNCDLFFDKVFADDTEHVSDFKNFSKFRSFAEVCDVVAGDNPGRQNDRERIIVYNIGIGIHDIYFAAQIFNRFQVLVEKKEKLVDVDMQEPKEKFWV